MPTIRCGLVVALTQLLAFSEPSTARSQTVRVRTVEATTRRLIGGAIVVLIDSSNRAVAQGLTDELGRIAFRAPHLGQYLLRADRIGHPGTFSEAFSVSDSVSITIVMPGELVELAELRVTAISQCERRPKAEQIVRLWEEARKALAASAITSSSELVELSVRRFRRYRTLSGSLKADSTDRQFTTRVSPFVGADPRTLVAGGYIQPRNGNYEFFAPDARALLSDEFLDGHCFYQVVPDREGADGLGLGFRPAKGQTMPDIEGVLWIDRSTSELRSLEFEFVNVPTSVRADGLGGRVEFQRLANGAWIVRDWFIRMPDRVVLERPGIRGRLATRRDSTAGFIDVGGSARPLGDATLHLIEPSAQVRQTRATLAEVRGRVVSPDGGPIEGALVAVEESDSVVLTSATGDFRVTSEGARRLSLRIRAVGYAPLAVGVTLSQRSTLDTTLVLSPVQQLDPIVVTGKTQVFRSRKMEGFERRRQEALGRFLTREELEDPLRSTLDLQLRRFGRINLVSLMSCGAFGYGAAAFGQRPSGDIRPPCGAENCFMSIYLDGALYYSPDMPGTPPDLRTFNLLTLEGVEVYRSPAEVPPEYNATNSLCGVILLWTRTG